MASISVYRHSDKGTGPVRFRVSDGRGVCLYWSAGPGSRNGDAGSNADAIERYRELIAKAYEAMLKEGKPLNSNVLKAEIERWKVAGGKGVGRGVVPVVERYRRFVAQARESGFVAQARYVQCLAIARRLERWAVITGNEGLRADGFTPDMLLSYRQFVFDEYSHVRNWPHLYPSGCRAPRHRRKNSSVVLEMKALKAFFTELENLEEIRRSPFRTMSREKQKSIMHVMYDSPVFLRKQEFRSICNARIPDHLEWVREIFVFNCCVGCRIGDIQRLGPENLEFSEDGIPYIHYIPSKTRQRQSLNSEVETPLVPMALKIAGKGLPRFNRLQYNSLLKDLLKCCGISRKVRVFNEIRGFNEYLPLHSIASSKLARKTHVDLVNKVQLNPWASGLHKEGSDAVFRYTFLELKDRYRLLMMALGDL